MDEDYLFKATESLAGAGSECVAGRYNNCANRSYYACFQAAIHALMRAGIVPPSRSQWPHDFVQAQFVSEFINRHKLYPAELRTVLTQQYIMRQAADYKRERVSSTQASRLLRRSTEFVAAVQLIHG